MSAQAIPVPGRWRRYTEVVEHTHGKGNYTILLREHPLYLQGYAPVQHRRRFAHLVDASKTPLYMGGLGDVTTTVVTGAAGAAAKFAAAPIASSLALPAMAVPIIGAGIVAIAAIFSALWGAHEARIKGAKTENDYLNSAVQVWESGLAAIFSAANSSDPAKNLTGAQAAQQVQVLWQQFWAQMRPYTTGPGRADASNGGANCGNGTLNPAGPCKGTPGGHFCDKSCTATCCVGCQALYPTMLQCMAVFQAGGGTVQACPMFASKYGFSAVSGTTYTYNPPTISATGELSSALSTLTGGSMLPLIELAAVAFMAFK